MLNEEGSTQLSKATANVYRATLFSAEILIVVAAIIFFAALAPAATALLVIGAAALLLLLGTLPFHAVTVLSKPIMRLTLRAQLQLMDSQPMQLLKPLGLGRFVWWPGSCRVL